MAKGISNNLRCLHIEFRFFAFHGYAGENGLYPGVVVLWAHLRETPAQCGCNHMYGNISVWVCYMIIYTIFMLN